MAALDARDRGFARALAMTMLRRRRELDLALQARLERPPPEAVMDILRLGAAQLLVLDTPAHAAVSTSVDLAGRTRATRSFKALVNGVLRALMRERPAPAGPEVLAPAWLLARWTRAYGEEAALATAALIAEEPPTDLTARDPAEAEAMAQDLQAELLPGGTLRTSLRGDPADWPGYGEGRWWVQDASAAVPARLLAARPGEMVLDLCAAPGGKTLQLAAAGAGVVSVDRSDRRLERLRENLVRTRLAAEVVAADATQWPDSRRFDAVLLDAPCTATGTFRRHPDVLWLARPSDVGRAAAVQTSLLQAAASRVKPGGRLVYCVCSLEPEEGEDRVATFLRDQPDFHLDPLAAGEGGAPEASLTPGGTLRILPSHRPGGLDGFFAARLLREGRLPAADGEANSGS